MTRWTRVWVRLAAGVAVLSTSVMGQVEQQRRPSDAAVFLQAVVLASDQPGRPRVDLYVQVPYNELMFVTNDGGYRARFELSAEIRSADGEVAWQKSQSVELQVKTFSQTVSDRLSNLRQFSATLAPGSYRIEVKVSDPESGKTETVKRPLIVRGLERDSLVVSDVLLVSRATNDGPHLNIVPNVSGSILRQADRFFLFFEVYQRTPADSLRYTYRFLDAAGKTVAGVSRIEAATGKMTQVVCRFDSVALTSGDYRVVVDVVPEPARDTSLHGRTSCEISIAWGLLPRTIRDLEKAIDQLRYIAKDEEIEYIRAVTNPEERQARFVEFWKKRDPDPATPQNELMEEYYARVAYSNEHFRHFVDGWKTDMGMVYIRFGPPENIERHPFEIDSRPYEVWYYYQLNRQFVFVDQTGFGDYRLVYPTTDLWGRVR